MTRISVAEAAGRLGVNVQRVHQRISDGSLPAQRVGHQWTLEEADVARLDRMPPGRPLSVRSAWLIALVADPGSVPASDVAASDRSRARSRLRRFLNEARDLHAAQDQELATAELTVRLRSLLRRRAERRVFEASSRDLSDLRRDGRIALSGVNLPASGIASGDLVEGYVAQTDLMALTDEFLLVDADHRRGNVVLHVIDRHQGALPRPATTNWLLMAADLAEHHRPRESARAAQVVYEAAAKQVGLSDIRVHP